MMVKKFSISGIGTIEEEQNQDQGEELYAISLGKSTTEDGKFNLTFAGETGKVMNLQLDDQFDISTAQKHTLVEFGSQVNALQWSNDGAHLIVAGVDKSVLVIDSKTKNSKKCSGITLDSEVVSASIDNEGENFCLSLKDGSVIIGNLAEAKLVKKVQIGKMLKGELATNQTSFAKNGDLYAPGKGQVQKLAKNSNFEIETKDSLPSTGTEILGV